MSFTSPQIGHRVRSFRELKGFTQHQIELELDASFGHLSKIESGKVNPTKETLLSISHILRLNTHEEFFLIGLNLEPVTRTEVLEAIKFANPILQSCQNPMILTDDLWFDWFINEAAFKWVGGQLSPNSREDIIQQKAGTHLLELLSNPEFGVSQMIDSERWDEFGLDQCLYWMHFISYHLREGQNWLENLVTNLHAFPRFSSIWKKALEQYSAERPMIKNFILPLRYDDKLHEYFIANIRLPQVPRFRLIEYLPYRTTRLKHNN